MIYLDLLWTFFKIGALTFGGGYAMLPLIQAEVASHGWISNEELINFIAVSESTPGPFAVNISTYVGITTGGLPGAFCATLGVVLPSFVIILIVAKCFEQFKKSLIVSGCMSGLKAAVIGMIGASYSHHMHLGNNGYSSQLFYTIIQRANNNASTNKTTINFRTSGGNS